MVGELRGKNADDGKIIETLRESDTVKKALAAEARAVLERRKFLVSRNTKIEVEETARFQKDEAAERAAREKVKAAQSALQAAANELNMILGERSAKSFAAMNERARIEQELCDTSHPAIAAFIDELHNAAHSTMKTRPEIQADNHRNQNTGELRLDTKIVGIAPAQRLEVIRVVIKAAEAMRLEADPTKIGHNGKAVEVTVESRLAALRASIPTVGEVR